MISEEAQNTENTALATKKCTKNLYDDVPSSAVQNERMLKLRILLHNEWTLKLRLLNGAIETVLNFLSLSTTSSFKSSVLEKCWSHNHDFTSISATVRRVRVCN